MFVLFVDFFLFCLSYQKSVGFQIIFQELWFLFFTVIKPADNSIHALYFYLS